MKNLVPQPDVANCNSAYCFVWVETWLPTLREECRLRVFENRVLRRIFGPLRLQGNGGNYTMRSLMICIPHPILFR
jgi:hypothetical protein